MDPIVRSGYSRALSVLPHYVLVDNNDQIFNAITKICVYEVCKLHLFIQ